MVVPVSPPVRWTLESPYLGKMKLNQRVGPQAPVRGLAPHREDVQSLQVEPRVPLVKWDLRRQPAGPQLSRAR